MGFQRVERFLGFAVLAGLTGCGSVDTINSDEVDSNVIWGRYGITHYSETQVIDFSAQFRVGGSTGTTVRLAAPSRVRVAGSEMEVFDGDASRVNLVGTFYSHSITAPSEIPEDYTFYWTRDDERQVENKIPLFVAVSVDADSFPAEISRREGLVVALRDFEASPATALGEARVTCVLKSRNLSGRDLESEPEGEGGATGNNSESSPGGEEEEARESRLEATAGAEGCRFTAEQMSNFVTGSASVHTVVSLSSSQVSGHGKGGTLSSRTVGPKVSLKIVE